MERAFDEIDAALADGEIVGIFPEGALTRDGEIAAFKSRRRAHPRPAAGAGGADGAARHVGEHVEPPQRARGRRPPAIACACRGGSARRSRWWRMRRVDGAHAELARCGAEVRGIAAAQARAGCPRRGCGRPPVAASALIGSPTDAPPSLRACDRSGLARASASLRSRGSPRVRTLRRERSRAVRLALR